MADVTITKGDGGIGAAAGAGVAMTAIQSAAGIIEWLLKAAMTSPLMAICAAFVVTCALRKATILSDQEATNLKMLILVAAGIEISTPILTAIENIAEAVLPWDALKQNITNKDITTPSAQVIVFGAENKSMDSLLPLLQTLAKKG